MRACPRRRWVSHRNYRLNHRFREQARSHIGDVFQVGTGLCNPLKGWRVHIPAPGDALPAVTCIPARQAPNEMA
ncbi:hypothetical protein C9382_15490 [Pseudomonas aylmerensis]|uniref:Uncharacterized protein n=1 Tax=Pseudomonas aylmerensis TaxID=1869229 RepID=A0A2T4FWT3_9PSED|nr:hypothetical protein C9382_15490 [Pseudomonas aylmerensis]